MSDELTNVTKHLIMLYKQKEFAHQHCIFRSMVMEKLGFCIGCDWSLNNGEGPCAKFRLDKLPIL